MNTLQPNNLHTHSLPPSGPELSVSVFLQEKWWPVVSYQWRTSFSGVLIGLFSFLVFSSELHY
jgi:hypothetical protein